MNEKIKGAKFHHIALGSHCFDETIAFYKALGFKLSAEWGSEEKKIAMMQIGDGGIFEIFSDGTDAPEQNARYFHLAIETDDPDGAYKLAIEVGAASHIEPKDVVIQSDPPMPVRLAFVVGLNGELLEFFQPK